MPIDGFVERICCPGCGCADMIERYSRPYDCDPIQSYLLDFYSPQGSPNLNEVEGGTYKLDQCSACGLVYQVFAPGPNLLESLYERWIDPSVAFELELQAREFRYYQRLSNEIHSIVRHFGRRPADITMLDFGMGWGEWCLMGAACGLNAAGTDLSKARQAHVTSRGIEVLHEDGWLARQFDVINAEQVFEHLVEPLEMLKRLVEVLAPGGLIKISVPDGSDFDRLIAVEDWTASKDSPDSLNVVAPLEHLNCFTPFALDSMAQAAGVVRFRLGTAVPVEGKLKEIMRPTYRAMRRRLSRTPHASPGTNAIYRVQGSE